MTFKRYFLRQRSEQPAKPVRDRYDKLMLANALVGGIFAIVSGVIALAAFLDSQASQKASDAKLAVALSQISLLARESSRQASALTGQVSEMRVHSRALADQLLEMRRQSVVLTSNADAARDAAKSAAAQIEIQKMSVLEQNRPIILSTVTSEWDSGNVATIVLTNDGLQSALIGKIVVKMYYVVDVGYKWKGGSLPNEVDIMEDDVEYRNVENFDFDDAVSDYKVVTGCFRNSPGMLSAKSSTAAKCKIETPLLFSTILNIPEDKEFPDEIEEIYFAEVAVLEVKYYYSDARGTRWDVTTKFQKETDEEGVWRLIYNTDARVKDSSER